MDQTAYTCRDEESEYPCATQPSHRSPNGSWDRTEAPAAPPANKKGRTALIWGVGSTVLSVIGFIALALFEQYNSSLSELRGDLKHFNETSSEFVKTDSFQRFRDQTKSHVKELQAIALLQSQLEKELRASEKAREEMTHEMQRLRERLAYVEGQHTALPIGHRSSSVNGEVRRSDQDVADIDR